MTHLRRWGAVWLVVALWIGSAVAQAITMGPEIAEGGWTVYWAATFENWQSEFLQLAFQAVFLLALKHVFFRADAEDQERLEHLLKGIHRRLDSGGIKPDPLGAGVEDEA